MNIETKIELNHGSLTNGLILLVSKAYLNLILEIISSFKKLYIYYSNHSEVFDGIEKTIPLIRLKL